MNPPEGRLHTQGSDTRNPPSASYQARAHRTACALLPPEPAAGPPLAAGIFFASRFELRVKEAVNRRDQPHRIRGLPPLEHARAPALQIGGAVSLGVEPTEQTKI